MRKLKIACTAAMSVGLVLLMAMPWVIALKPEAGAPKQDVRIYLIVLTSYAVLLFALFFVALVLAWRIVVKQREEYAEASLKNLQDLIEGTLNDHKRGQN